MKTSLISPKLFLLSVITFVLASCSKYQTNFISSANVARDTQTGRFQTENDSMKITYAFLGNNTQVQLDVLNKLNEPLYIDWQKSAFVINDKAYTYADKVMKINGDVSGTTIRYGKNVSGTDATINATATLPKDVTFIPPHTQVSSVLTNLNNYVFDKAPDSAFVKLKLQGTMDGGQEVVVKNAEFTDANSPIRFGNYLTFYTLNNNVPKLTAIKHQFYVSRIIKSLMDPKNFELLQNAGGDYYYTSQKTGTGKVATGVLVGAALAGGLAAGASQGR